MYWILWCVFVACVGIALGPRRGSVFAVFAASATLMGWLLSFPIEYLGVKGSGLACLAIAAAIVVKAAYDTRSTKNKRIPKVTEPV